MCEVDQVAVFEGDDLDVLPANPNPTTVGGKRKVDNGEGERKRKRRRRCNSDNFLDNEAVRRSHNLIYTLLFANVHLIVCEQLRFVCGCRKTKQLFVP